MKRAILTITSIFFALTLSAQINYTIKGTVHGMNDEMIYLYTSSLIPSKIDSTIVTDNSFTFKGTYSEVCFATISLSQERKLGKRYSRFRHYMASNV